MGQRLEGMYPGMTDCELPYYRNLLGQYWAVCKLALDRLHTTHGTEISYEILRVDSEERRIGHAVDALIQEVANYTSQIVPRKFVTDAERIYHAMKDITGVAKKQELIPLSKSLELVTR